VTRPIVISVAPVSGAGAAAEPAEVAREAVESRAAGAALVHLHVRERDGRLTANPAVFQETIDLIRAQSDLIIQASTGGVSDLTIEERCVALGLKNVEMSSLNSGSVNLGEAVYKNPFQEIKYVTRRCLETGVIPEVEVFEMGMVHNMFLVAEEMPLPQPLLFDIVLGHRGGCPATPKTLALFSQYIPPEALWSITQYGRENDFSLLAAALGLGACMVRIGFEDSNALSATQKAARNAELVARMAEVIRAMGFRVATPAEAREMFGLKQL
jgi:3-keto-5-aminohexanoate cleavage enzyme